MTEFFQKFSADCLLQSVQFSLCCAIKLIFDQLLRGKELVIAESLDELNSIDLVLLQSSHFFVLLRVLINRLFYDLVVGFAIS